MKSRFIKIAGLFIIAATVFFIGKAIARNWEIIKEQPFHFNGWFLLLSALSALLMYASWSLLWKSILSQLRYHVKFSDIFQVYIKTQPLKYIPGKIALFLARSAFMKQRGIPFSIGIYSSFLEVFYGLLGATLVSTLSLSLYLKNTFLGVAIVAIVLIVGLVILSPPVFYPLTDRLFRILKQRPIPFHERSSAKSVYQALGFSLCGVLFFATTHFFLLKSLADVPFQFYFSFVSIAAFTFIAGMLVVISPSGIGVREGLFFLFLKPFIGAPLALAFTATSRLWTIAYDFIFLAGILFINKLRPHRK